MKKLIPPKAPLNIVPFIDIMLVLLCIVLSVSTFISQGSIKLSLPESSTHGGAEKHEKPALLEIGSDNTIICEGRKIGKEDIREVLLAIPKGRHLELRIDKSADFGIFVTVLDALKELKHDNFSIATKQSDI
ncbi:MAG: biopolymer transporter ExbD [Succinivibrionaceae bacterium]|nr:biopolymer transporter ExbD [Succinivibrionaceae bacterium]